MSMSSEKHMVAKFCENGISWILYYKKKTVNNDYMEHTKYPAVH